MGVTQLPEIGRFIDLIQQIDTVTALLRDPGMDGSSYEEQSFAELETLYGELGDVLKTPVFQAMTDDQISRLEGTALLFHPLRGDQPRPGVAFE